MTALYFVIVTYVYCYGSGFVVIVTSRPCIVPFYFDIPTCPFVLSYGFFCLHNTLYTDALILYYSITDNSILVCLSHLLFIHYNIIIV